MYNKKIIIIGIVLLIVVGAVLAVALSTPKYERIEITPNGTTIGVLGNNQTEFCGEFDGVKIWYWDKGVLVTYNNHEGDGVIKLLGLSFNTINELIKAGDVLNMDGFTCYVINTDDFDINLYDIIKVNHTGEFYCIPLSNATTHDNIIICSYNKDTALDMAKSVEYKNVYPDDIGLDDVVSAVENVTDTVENVTNAVENMTWM